jgi:hypothetical protein
MRSRTPGGETRAQVQSSLPYDKLQQPALDAGKYHHERMTLSQDHIPVMRVGYLGAGRQDFVERMNRMFGPDNWTIGYVINGQTVDRDDALKLYQASYEEFFRKHPEYGESLARRAKDVFDTDPRNVESGLDWHKQEGDSSHLQDIAVRRAFKTLGLEFRGEQLLQIRGRSSDLPELNPGRVPFIAPELINTDREFVAPWVNPGSVEDFWQNNKFLCVKSGSDLLDRLRAEIDQSLKANKRDSWKLIGERLASLTLMGGGDATLTERYHHFLRHHSARGGDQRLPSSDQPVHWLTETIRNLPHVLSSQNLRLDYAISVMDCLLPMINTLPSESVQRAFFIPQCDVIENAALCSLSDVLSKPYFGNTQTLGALLSAENALITLETDPIAQERVRRSPLCKMSEEEIRQSILRICDAPSEWKERWLNAIVKIKAMS